MRRRAPVRVGLIIGQLTHGGAERQLFELAVRLPARGIEPHVFCLSMETSPYGDRLREAGVPVHAIPRRRSVEWHRIRLLAHGLRQKRIDVAHAYLLNANAYAWVACRWARVKSFLPSVRNLEPDRPWPMREVDRVVLTHSPLVLVNSQPLANWIAVRYGVAAGRVRVVLNGLDLARFETIPRLPERRDGDGTVGSVSLFKPQKRIPFLLDMAARVRAKHPRVRFRLIGDGPQRAEMLRLRDRMGLAEWVEMPGACDDVAGELARFDLFVLASDREGLPNAVLEAMAAARPVVASRVGGTSDVVQEGVSGLLFNPQDPCQGADALVALLDDPRRASDMGQAGRDMVQARYSAESMVDRTVSVYDELLASGGGS